MSLILGLETSCDETAAAVVEDGVFVRSNIIATQHKLHERYGGVVPEIASRAHLERISPVVQDALSAAGVTFADLDAIAVGNRPGLIGSLLVGVSAAKAIAWALGKPLIGVDHVRAHLYAGWMEEKKGQGPRGGGQGERQEDRHGGREARRHEGGMPPPSEIQNPKLKASPLDTLHPAPYTLHPDRFPALGLVVSGGHTSLYELTSPIEMRVIGRTIDDAVGEAYDKAAVILKVGYPGGPKLDKLAQTGDASAYKLPRSMLEEGSLDFSFSGLKTALLYLVRGRPVGRGEQSVFERSADDLTDEQRRNMAAAFQAAAIEAVITKIRRAIDQLTAQGRRPRTLLVGGGVSANSLLRKRAVELGQIDAGAGHGGLEVRLPPMSLCLDNAAMIAGIAHEYFIRGQMSDLGLQAMSTTRV